MYNGWVDIGFVRGYTCRMIKFHIDHILDDLGKKMSGEKNIPLYILLSTRF